MLLTAPLLCTFFLALASHARPETGNNQTHSEFLGTCHKIAADISSASQVFYPPDPQYAADISHFAYSSVEVSACSVEPGSAEDVSKIIKILGSCRTPFAVKGGGHTTNPGFSSTPGVQIALSRFNSTKVNAEDGTVEVGPGLIWDEVYAALAPLGLSVVGGRIPGVGVAGLTLGGGYSYKSNQYGLVIDNVVGYELVLPNGTIKHVTSKDEDLWFGLRGGQNNFGIVTKFIFKLHPQTDVWGGVLFYTEDKLDQVKEALIKFQQSNDTKAGMIFSYVYMSGQLTAGAWMFYDAPTDSGGVFDDFVAIEHEGNASTMSLPDFFINENSTGAFGNTRNFYQSCPVIQYSPAVIDAYVNQTRFWGKRLSDLDPTTVMATLIQPFQHGVYSHGSPSAYPPDRSQLFHPTDFSVAWADPSLDGQMADALREGAKTIREVALADGQDLSHTSMYVNFALFGTPLEDIYGGNLPRLRGIKAKIDPERVMDLAGGWKL